MAHDVPVIQLKDISFTWPGAGAPTLDGVNLTIETKDRIGIMAPNGSGKTTLFHTIMGLCIPDAGTIEVLGQPMKTEKDFEQIRSRVGLLFQDADDQLFSPTVIDDVCFGPLNLGFSPAEALEQSRAILDRLGIANLEDCITHKLSGGQKRLVALAAVMAMEPELLLLDEPTAGLDAGVKNTLADTLVSLSIPYIVISHEFDFISAVTNRIFSMEKGRILTDDEVHIHQHEHMHKLGKFPHKHV
ncbi:cobalt/nickel transport system ATP-binding protein [Desulfocicer vacuolatum DSM 3385]|uniref:Cobalt/nickel transport system ATP-binding protein n=1 Tax=Desulfocicer vacuolatum DSM 3385 TaxID=1121400 RepID=A0A1W1ZBW4_9BACT|nr:ABC transporter ATP-binding protein [Desulfocicer vacuolatum]SMC45914.1 cobalt/nickel transport system ATP-binding protein [Desulfocicer vacuolatum DSM 3385]